jgi:predicted PhzF superfamily epimerase YddE/YHI9
VQLCGHATLAAGHIPGDEQHYLTHSGELMTTARADGRVGMGFPADPPRPLDSYKELVIALGGTHPARVARGVPDILADLPSAADVRNLQPDLARISEITARGIIVTARGGQVRVTLRGDRVTLLGQAVTAARTALLI